MLILSIDTSATASAALLGDGEVLGAFATEDTRSHAEVLAPGISRLLEDTGIAGTGLDAVVVGVGPGPFTGLRAGIATARTLSYVWNVPLHGVMSLDSIAWDVDTSPGSEFLVATDARRSEVYWARYRSPGTGSGSRLAELLDGPHVGHARDLPSLPAYGRGAGLYNEELDARLGFEDRQPQAESLGHAALARLAAGQQLLDSTPLYLRESDAKVPGPRKRAL